MNGTEDRRGDEDSCRRGPDSTLSAALAGLDDGCSMLVTGDVPDDAYRTAASRYFGATDRRRRRVLALTSGSADATEWLPGGVEPDDEDTAVVALGDGLRDPAAAADTTAVGRRDRNASGGTERPAGTETPDGPDDPGGGAGTDRVDLDLDDDAAAEAVRTALLDAIDAVAPDDPATRLELRVGVYRVDALSAALGAEATHDLLREVAATTRARGGMAHFHLPRAGGDDDGDGGRHDPVVDDLVEALDDELDVTVELRSREASPAPEERWHILGWGYSEWNPLR